LELSPNPDKENQIPWLTGATVTSKGVLAGDNAVIDVYNKYLKEGK